MWGGVTELFVKRERNSNQEPSRKRNHSGLPGRQNMRKKKIIVWYCIVLTLFSVGLLIRVQNVQRRYAQSLEELQRLSALISLNYNDFLGEQFIDFALEDTSGKTWRLSTLDSILKIVVLFNINDCSKCLQDYRIYNSVLDRFPSRTVTIIAISNNQPADIFAYVARKGIRYLVLCDPTSLVKNAIGVHASPVLFFLNNKNNILDCAVPGQGRSHELFDKINERLRELEGGAISRR